MHADKRYRANLVTDLMKPARNLAEELALDFFATRKLARGDVTKTRRGTCRLGPTLIVESLAADANHAPPPQASDQPAVLTITKYAVRLADRSDDVSLQR